MEYWISKPTRVPAQSRTRAQTAHTRTRIHLDARTPTNACSHPRPPSLSLTHTHKYVILITFPRQQWFRERASLLRYTYIASVVVFCL